MKEKEIKEIKKISKIFIRITTYLQEAGFALTEEKKCNTTKSLNKKNVTFLDYNKKTSIFDATEFYKNKFPGLESCRIMISTFPWPKDINASYKLKYSFGKLKGGFYKPSYSVRATFKDGVDAKQLIDELVDKKTARMLSKSALSFKFIDKKTLDINYDLTDNKYKSLLNIAKGSNDIKFANSLAQAQTLVEAISK